MAAGIVALGASTPGGVQEGQRIGGQPLANDPEDIARSDQARQGLSDPALTLQSELTEPTVRQREALAAVIVFDVVHPTGSPALQHRAVFRHLIGH